MQETKEQSIVRDAAILSFADLIRHSMVNKRSAHNRYPVHAFGRLIWKHYRNLYQKWIPYLAEELKAAVDSGNSNKIQVYTTAIGKTGHSQMLSVFGPYLEGRRQISTFQRLVMVLSLDKLAELNPKVAQSALYKIYSNNSDTHEIRTAAVYLLMTTNPPASMLQRMAEYTNYDSNKHVNSAVKSAIEALAKLQENQHRNISDSAKAAQPLLTSESFELQYSRTAFMNLRNPLIPSAFFVEANYIGSDDSSIPKRLYVSNQPSFKALEMLKIELGATVSSPRDLWNVIRQKLFNNEKARVSEKDQEQEYSPENIAKRLGIHGDELEKLEGHIFMNDKYRNFFLSFDNHSIEKVTERKYHFSH